MKKYVFCCPWCSQKVSVSEWEEAICDCGGELWWDVRFGLTESGEDTETALPCWFKVGEDYVEADAVEIIDNVSITEKMTKSSLTLGSKKRIQDLN